MDRSSAQIPNPLATLHPSHPTSAMSLKNGTYQLQFIPAGGEPDLGELLATGEAMSRPVRLLPNTPPYFRQQHVRVLDT